MYSSKKEKNYLWIFFTMLSIGLGQSLVFTSIPILARENGLTEVQVSLIFSISATAWFITSPLWGRYSDKYGPRIIAIIGCLGYSANMILIILPIYLFENGVLAGSMLLPLLILSRISYGIFGSATRPALFGYAGKISSPKERANIFSNLESGFVIGTVLGPIIGAFFFRYVNNELPFILFGLLGLIIATQLNIRLRNEKEFKLSDKKPMRLKMHDSKVWPYVFVSSIFSITQAIIFQTLGFFIFDKLNYNVVDAAVYVSISFGIYSTSVVITQSFLNPLFNSIKVMILVGPILCMSSFIFMTFANDIFSLTGALMLNGIGYGITRPSYASALSLSHKKIYQSSAAGLLGSTYPIGHMIAPLFISLYVFDFSLVYYLSAFMCFISVAFTFFHPHILKSSAYE